MRAAATSPRFWSERLPRLLQAAVRRVLLALAVLLGSACVSHNYAPVEDLARPTPVLSGSHQVRRGDTLYSIAWRYGRDYRELAKINNIRYPYLIKPGQRLQLKAQSGSRPAVAARATRAPARSAPATAASSPQRALQTRGTPNWQWPLEGKLIGHFAGSGGRGIDIQASHSAAVRAAADGVVVYAGDGLIGYGNLVIIKHNETFLSAYAHNRELLVNEQKSVKAGQRIAEIGSTGKKSRVLHFEIRKNGKPVNPLRYLPKG